MRHEPLPCYTRNMWWGLDIKKQPSSVFRKKTPGWVSRWTRLLTWYPPLGPIKHHALPAPAAQRTNTFAVCLTSTPRPMDTSVSCFLTGRACTTATGEAASATVRARSPSPTVTCTMVSRAATYLCTRDVFNVFLLKHSVILHRMRAFRDFIEYQVLDRFGSST